MEVIFRKIEQRMVEIMQIIEGNMDSYCAVHIRLSNLDKQNQSLYQSKLAVNLINEVMAAYDGWLIFFLDHDLIGIFKNIHRVTVLDNLVHKVRDIFMNDKLAYFSNGLVNPDFALIYEFPFNYKHFTAIFNRKLPSLSVSRETNSHVNIVKNISAGDLVDLERNIFDLDINNIIRKQAICGLLNDKKTLKPLFYEIYISLPRLSRILSFSFENGANRFLLKYLEEILQCKLLECLIQDSRILLGHPLSIHLTIDVVLSELFTMFHSVIKEKIAQPIVIEFSVADLFLDVQNSIKVIRKIRALDYKVCIKNINRTNISLLQSSMFDVDFGKINLSEELYSNRNHTDLQNSLKQFGLHKLIMHNCNNFDIIEFGKNLGIHLFQGWECDQMLKNRNSVMLEFC